MTDEKIYEQQHLTTVYHELQAAKKVYEEQLANTMKAVSYTHLTLPTICSV